MSTSGAPDPLKSKASDDAFHHFSSKVAAAVGSSISFVIAIAVVGIWAVSGPLFHFSDTWQLVINTGTTIITFLMVFVIQNTQNRDARAVHLKLDELIYSTKRARNLFLNLDTMTNEELDQLEQEFRLQRMKKMPADDLKKRALVSSSTPSHETRADRKSA